MLHYLLLLAKPSDLHDILVWACLVVLAVILTIFVVFQYRQRRLLKGELSELGKIKKHHVEYEFVLKAMRLSVWHLDTSTMKLTYEQDFRERGIDWVDAPDNETINKSTSLLEPQDAQRVAKALGDLCKGLTNDYHQTYKVLTPYGSKKFYWEESYATVASRNVDGTPSGIVGTTMRIDDRKAMEEALVEARIRAEESDRLKSAFIANMSHEIRTPLNAIVGFTSVLPDVEDGEERQALLKLIQQNTQKLLGIITDVVNISKLETGKENMTLTTFDLNDMLNQLMAETNKNVSQGISVGSQFAGNTLMVTTDEDRLKEILNHLLSNAVKFTQQGSITVGYEMSASNHLRIWVSDTGKGIDEEQLPHIFERFYKADEFIPGAGLGLSVCQLLVNTMEGSIEVQSKLGEGSTFTIDIPVQLA